MQKTISRAEALRRRENLNFYLFMPFGLSPFAWVHDFKISQTIPRLFA